MLLPSSRIVIAFTAAALPLGASAFTQTSQVPLVVEQSSLGPDARQSGRSAPVLTIDLFNSGTKTITAWAYWLELRLDDGTTRRIPRTMDALPASEPDRFVVTPRGRRSDTQALPAVSPATATDVTIQIAAVIFDDATASGDESLLNALFARRAQHRETWNALVTILEVARARHADPAMVLEQVRADLAVADPKIRGAGDAVIVQQRALAGMQGRGPRSADAALSDLVRYVTSRRDAFSTQATRRPQK